MVAYFTTGRYEPNIPTPPPPPIPNGLDDYLAAGAMFEANGGDKPMYDPQGNPVLLNESSVVQANQSALARLRVGLTRECAVPFSPSLTTRVEYLGRMRALARLLSAECDVYAAGDNPHRAASSAIDAIQMGIDFQRGGALMHGLTGSAIQSIGQSALMKVSDKLDETELGNLVARLQKIVLNRVASRDILDIERRWTLASLAGMDGADLMLSYNGSGQPEEDSNNRRSIGRLVWHFARDRTLRDLENYMDASARESAKPPAQRQPVPIPGGYAGIYAPVFMQADGNLNRPDLRNRLILISMAVRRYRLEHCALPESLDKLHLAPKALLDPDSGKPIIYKLNGADYLLYGIGPDGKDDGGVPADEGVNPPIGDLGIRRFVLAKPGGRASSAYRLVPHMLPPILPPGSPPLKD